MLHRILVPLVLLVGIIGCAGQAPTPTPAPAPTALPSPAATVNPLAGGIVATFKVSGQEFKVWVENPQTIQAIVDLQAGKSAANIPNGKILRGAGQGNHNAPYAWHLDPNEIEMAEMTTEVCDAEPGYVEQNIDEFVNVVGRYCPWDATLVGVMDYR